MLHTFVIYLFSLKVIITIWQIYFREKPAQEGDAQNYELP